MKAKIKTSLIVMISLALILIGTNVYARTGTTINETTRIRSEASTSADTVALLSTNTEVEIVGEDGDWYQVEYSSYTGYIRKDLLDVPDTYEEETDIETTVITEENNNEENSTETETTDTELNETEEQSEEIVITDEASGIQTGDEGTLLENASMRILPSINSSIIAEITANTNYTVVEVMNNWCHIEVGNYSGWIFLSKIEPQEQETETTTQETTTEETIQNDEISENNENNETNTSSEEETTTSTTIKYVSAETLNMRETATTTGTVIMQLSLNTEVTVIEEADNEWTKITYNGKTGYVASQYLSDTKISTTSRSENTTRNTTTATNEVSQTTETADTTDTTTESTSTTQTEETTSSSSSSSSSSKGSEVVALAKQYLGYNYVSGGASPSTGFDCSGFTYYIYKQFGVTLSRTTSGQASNGTAVSKSDLQPGDIVVFKNSSNTSIGHVGIYIGSNTFIHAANSRKGVITTSLSDSYYSARYVTARRIF